MPFCTSRRSKAIGLRMHVVTPSARGIRTEFVNTILANAMLQEFVPFIVLLFSLYRLAAAFGRFALFNLMNVPLATISSHSRLYSSSGTVAPVHLVGLAEGSHLIDPGDDS